MGVPYFTFIFDFKPLMCLLTIDPYFIEDIWNCIELCEEKIFFIEVAI